ncbi:MAG TPA: hypothetical protein ENI87_03615 [bacterium]|nr:hypothetical protein [bacterium]
MSNAISEVATCNIGPSVWLVYLDNGVLRYLQSADAGDSWSTQAVVLNDTSLGAVTSPTVGCEADRLYAAYVVGGNAVAFSRVGAAGAVPQTVTLSDTSEAAGRPVLASRGNYVFCAWRGGAVGGGSGPARIKLATSVDLGATFAAPLVDGDGTAAQEQPQLLLDGARIWLAWRDYRNGTPALFHSRTEQ